MFKPHFTSSHTEKAKEALNLLKNEYNHYSLDQATHIVSLGGDGHMLKVLHKYKNTKLPIFGMNRGSFGFLMNHFDIKNLENQINNAKNIRLMTLKLTAINDNDEVLHATAFNEVSILRSKGQAAKLKISIDGVERMNELVCDGMLVATPAGSTAYNRACNGPILPFNSKIVAITPISPFQPRWRGAILLDDAVIEIENLYTEERPTSVGADFLEFRRIKKVIVQKSNKKSPTLLFDPDFPLDDRIIGEQFLL